MYCLWSWYKTHKTQINKKPLSLNFKYMKLEYIYASYPRESVLVPCHSVMLFFHYNMNNFFESYGEIWFAQFTVSLFLSLSRSSYQSCTPRVSSVLFQMMMTWQQLLIVTSSTPFRLLPSIVVEAPHRTQVTMVTGCPSKTLRTLTNHTHLVVFWHSLFLISCFIHWFTLTLLTVFHFQWALMVHQLYFFDRKLFYFGEERASL